jgi:hypothetical protein
MANFSHGLKNAGLDFNYYAEFSMILDDFVQILPVFSTYAFNTIY